MEYSILLSHLSLSIILFLIMNWIGKHSSNAGYIQMSVLIKADEAPAFNFIYRAFAPIAFITIISALLYAFKYDLFVQNIYLVVVYYFIIRLFFNIITGRSLLLNWKIQFLYILVAVPISYYVYENIILHREFLFPSPEKLGNAVWLAIIAFLYQTFNNIKLSDIQTKKRKGNYLQNRYDKYKILYGNIITNNVDTKTQECMVYSVLIYEAFNRPKIYRFIENILFRFGLAKTLGIMQVTTKDLINDKESVLIGTKKIVTDYKQANSKKDYGEWRIRGEVLKKYNPDNDYINEVNSLYDEIAKIYYPELQKH